MKKTKKQQEKNVKNKKEWWQRAKTLLSDLKNKKVEKEVLLLWLSAAMLAASLLLFLKSRGLMEKVQTTIKYTPIVLNVLKNKAQNLVNMTVMRNTEKQNLDSVVAVMLVSNRMGVKSVEEESFDHIVKSGKTVGSSLIGSGFFIREKLLSKKSKTVMSAAHVCIYGLGRRKLQDTLSAVTDQQYVWEDVPYGLLLKNHENETFKVKKISLNIDNDICVMEVEKPSSASMPVDKNYIPSSLTLDKTPSKIKTYAVQPYYHVWVNEGMSFSTNFFVIGLNDLCEPLEALQTKKIIHDCLNNNSSCTKQQKEKVESLFQDFFEFQYFMSGLEQCINTGVMSDSKPTFIFYQMMNAAVVPGNSGGAVVDGFTNLVIGVISATDRRSNVGLFVPIFEIQMLEE